MADNPYTPPRSAVKDVGPERLLAERPRPVVHAVVLLWISLVLAVPLIYAQQRRSPDESGTAVWILIAVILALVVAVNVFIWRGSNWARILFLVLAVISLLSFLGSFAELFGRPAIEIVLEIATIAIDVAAVYLLFTKPGSLWFRRAD